MAAIDALLRATLEKGGSDLHLTIGLPPKARISGSLLPLAGTPLDAAAVQRLLEEICPENRWKDFLERHDLDMAYEIPGVARFRCNFLYNHWGVAAVFREIPVNILSFDALKLPQALKKLCQLDQGLVLVTGPTGSGKSTTLAAMIDYINETRSKHIITIEDPIEFVHQNKKSVIVHREVGEHTASFAAALKGAMRHDPDILLVGEMRELETIKLALGCASMGMLVFATLNQVRVMLAGCLAGVVAQLLCKRIPKGRCAVHEILLQHEALPNTIRSGRIADIKSIIDGGGADGMIAMDISLMNRVKDGTIEPKEAYMKAANKAPFAQLLQPGDLEGGH
jgi:twitching motility protein PilT